MITKTSCWLPLLMLLSPTALANTQTQAEQHALAAEQAPLYELSHTAVHQLPASNGRQYEVWIDLPSSYGKDHKKLPVLFVSDANYAFPLIRSIRNRLGAGGQNIEDFVIVGLSYAKGDTPTASRNLDYTPTENRKGYGGGAQYAEYLQQQVVPFVLKHYQVDPNRKLFVGHSYGGLLGTQILLTKPETFDTYILSSPSLWFDKKYMFSLEQQYTDRLHHLKKLNKTLRVQLYAAEFEQKKDAPRYAKSVDILADMQLFEKTLKSRNYPGLHIESQIIADEDHLSVFPSMISRALVKLLPGYGPYTPG